MDYKYINQETIDSGGKNITSPEMFAEARIYNMEAAKNYSKRYNSHTIFNIWIILQYFLIFIGMFLLLVGRTNYEKRNQVFTPGWRIAIGVVGFFAYLGLVTYFVFIKNCRERWVLALISVPAIAVSLIFAIFPVGNFTAAYFYNKIENDLSKELGYPSFPRLMVTTVNSDADNITNLTFDSIREKANIDHPHDGTFL